MATRTIAGLISRKFSVGKRLTPTNRLHIVKTGSGEDAEEIATQRADVTFFTHHALEDWKGSTYETALAYDPKPLQQEIDGMENVEASAQPVKGIDIGKDFDYYSVEFFTEDGELLTLEPEHGITLKGVEILHMPTPEFVAKWTAKGCIFSQPYSAALMELAHNGALECQFRAWQSGQVDKAKKAKRAEKAHPGQGDLASGNGQLEVVEETKGKK